MNIFTLTHACYESGNYEVNKGGKDCKWIALLHDDPRPGPFGGFGFQDHGLRIGEGPIDEWDTAEEAFEICWRHLNNDPAVST
jgi:hypothetical protein